MLSLVRKKTRKANIFYFFSFFSIFILCLSAYLFSANRKSMSSANISGPRESREGPLGIQLIDVIKWPFPVWLRVSGSHRCFRFCQQGSSFMNLRKLQNIYHNIFPEPLSTLYPIKVTLLRSNLRKFGFQRFVRLSGLWSTVILPCFLFVVVVVIIFQFICRFRAWI